MKKKLMALLLAFVCAVGSFSAMIAVEQPVAIEAAAKKKAPSLSKVYSAVKKAYGENYLPNIRLKKDDIKSIYGISSSWYSGAIAETCMINIQADEFIVVKAKNSNAKKKIKKALNAYREKQIELQKNYVNYEKRVASRVYLKGDYVCYICLGYVDKNGKDEEEMVKAYKAETAKGVKAIQKLYK